MSDKGLRDVIAAQTNISDIDGAAGRLWYVGYTIEDLARNASFEEIIYLLHNLELPTRPELEKLNRFLIRERELHPFLARMMPTLAQNTSPMSMLRTSVSASSAFDPDGWDESPEAEYRKAMRLIAETPTLIATFDRVRTGREVIPPNPGLSHAANFLWMLHGQEPDPEDADTLDTTFVLYADHTMNASTFTARIIASTLSDTFSAMTGAIGALKGPLHGGANEAVMQLLLTCTDATDAERKVRDMLTNKQKVPGFGHRVYRTFDPRAHFLRKMSKQLGEAAGNTKWYEMSERLIPILRDTPKSSGEPMNLNPNVDFFSASAYYTMGIPIDLFTPIFGVARVTGWSAHVMEQHRNNRIIRPTDDYVGPFGLKVVPIEQRQ